MNGMPIMKYFNKDACLNLISWKWNENFIYSVDNWVALHDENWKEVVEGRTRTRDTAKS